MAEFFFDLQRFATVADGTVTLSTNETYTLDGVDYKADTSSAVLKATTTETDGTYTATAITGINSGTVTASPSGKTDPAINFVGSTAFNFTCTGDDDALKVGYGNTSINYTSGNLTYSATGLTMPQGTIGIGGTLINFLPFNVELTVPSSGATLTFDSTGSAKFNVSDTLGAKLSFDENIAEVIAGLDKSDLVALAALAGITLTEGQAGALLNIAVPIIQKGLSLDLSGTIDYNAAAKSVLFEKNTTTNLYLNNSTISFTTDADAGVTFAVENNALTVTPQDGDGSLDVVIKNGDKITFAGNVEIAGGSFIFDLLNQKVSVTAGTTTTITLSDEIAGAGGRSFTISADQDTGFNLALDETGNKLTLTPADENPLHLQIKNGDAVILDRDVALTGSVVIGMDDNTFTVTQGTALTFRGETGDTSVTTTITATGDAGITLAVDTDGKITLTPGADDGSLNITRKRDDTTTVFDFDLNVSGGSISVDPTSGKFTVEEGTTLEIINNLSGSYTSMAVEGGDASCTLTTNSDGTLALNVESGDGKLHFLHKHGDTTIFDMAVELSGTITFDATDNTITAADGTKLAVAFGDRELTASVNGDAGFGISVASGIIKLTPGENDGSIDLKLTNGDRTVFDGNLSVSGGGVSLELPTQTLTFDAGVAATVTIGDRVFVYSLPNGAEQKLVIDDTGKFNLTFEDSEPLHVKYTNGTTTVLDADITIDGKVVVDPNANSVSIAKDTTATVAYANGHTLTFTAMDDAGITASMDDAGKLRLAANEGNGEIHIIETDGDTVRELDVDFTGAIVLDATNQKIYAEKGTTLTRTIDALDVVESITVTDDAGFTFAFDDGKVIITPEEGDGKLQITTTQGERTFTAELEISGGSIIFDSSNNSLTVTKDTKAAITVGDYTVELAVTDAASITFNVDDAGKFVVSAKEGDGELVFTLKKGDTVLNTGSVEFDGTIEFDIDKTVGVTKDTSATFTLGDYKYSITANEAATINLSEKNGAIVISAPEGDGSLDIMLTKGDSIVFAGNVEYTGSFTIDPANQKISVSKDSQTKITVGDYTIELAVTDEASIGFAIGDGKITLTATEGDGKTIIDITKSGSSLLSGEVELDGKVTFDMSNQKVSVAKDTTLTFTRNEITTSITATDDAGFTVTNDGSKITITPDDGDGKLQLTRTQDTDIFSAELEINGSITYDMANNNLALTKDTTTTVTIGKYTVELTALDDAGLNFSVEGDKITITPQDSDGGSTHVKVTNGDDLIFENTAGIANGSITYDFANQQLAIPAGTTLALEQGDADSEIYFTAQNDITLNIDRKDKTNVNYFKLVNDAVTNITIVRDGNTIFSGNSTISGVFSYRADTRTFGIIGSDSRHTGDEESSFTLEIGDSTVYTFKAETNGNTVVTAFDIDDSGNITLSYPDDEHNLLVITAAKDGSEIFSGEVAIDGSIVYNTISNAVTIPADTITTVKVGGYTTMLMVTDDAGFTINAGEGKITLTPGDGDGKLLAAIFDSDDEAIFIGRVEVSGGSIVYDAINSAVSVTKGTTTTVTLGESSIALTANDDAGVNFSVDDGKFTITPQNGDGSIDVVYSEGGQVAFESNIEISGGSITFDALNNKVGLTKDTRITLTQPDDSKISVKALDDAAIAISAADDGGVRIAPDSGDGDLQLSVTRDGFTRTATLGIEGAVVYQTGGNISLEDGTTINLGWTNTEGVNIYNLKLTSRGSSGSIAFDAEKGLGVTSDDDKLDLEISSPFAESSIKFEGIQGTLWYNSGKVTLTEGTSFKSTGIFQSDDVNVAFEAVDGDVYVEFHTNYFIYGAGTGTFKHTMTAPDGTTGTFNINEGSLKVEHDTDGFTITEGSDITVTPPDETSDSILPFTTGAAGEYTINGHKLTTTAEGVQLIPTSNGMVLASNEDVTCDGLTFTGGGSVTLTADGNHIIGAGVSIADFDAGESFVLTTAGTVTVDGKTFELTEDVAKGITVTGAQDGYTFGHTKDDDSVFVEKFAVAGDSTYSVQIQHNGLLEVDGISADTTITGGATRDGATANQNFDIVTEKEGTFTIGKKAYSIGGDSIVTINAAFESSDAADARARSFNGLEGTVSGDIAGDYITVNSANDPILVKNDDDFKIVAGANGTELHDISSGATLETYGGVSKVYTDTTGDFTFGASDEDDSIAVTVVGDDNVVFDFDSDQYITNIESVDGSLMFSAMDFEFAINGVGVTTDGEFSSVGAYNTEDRGGMLFFHDVKDGSNISTDNPANVWKQIRGENTTINGNSLVLNGDDNGIWISDKNVVDLDEGASLTVSEAGDYTVNTAELTADSGDTFIGLENATDAYIYDENNPIITKKTSTAEIVDNFTHGFDYGTPITSQSAVKELLESGDRDQILSMYFDDTVSADFSGNNGYKNITLGGEYAQSLKFNNQGYNVAVVDENARGKKEISTGNGGDLVVIDDTKAQVSVMSGTGNDTIVSKGENVNISLSGGKNDLFIPAGNATVAGYDAKTASGFATSKKNIASAIEDGSIDFADGNLSLDSAKITFENTSEVVALYDRYGDKQLVGFTSQDDLLDARNYAEDIIFVGKGNSTMLGGSANDTILAKAGDIVDGGAGRNLVKLPDERTPFDAGTDILLVNGDRDTVENFKAGFGNHDDRIYIDTSATPEFKFDGSNLSVTSGGNLRGILENVANNSDFVEFMAIDDDGYNTKVAVAQENAFIIVDDELADLYYGKNSGVDFSNYTKMLNLDMDNDDGDGIIFYGINSVIAGSGLTTIVGTNGDDTLVAGSGGTRVWSNWGNDIMVGNNSATKDKETEFFYLAGDGHDTIRNFEFFTTENALTADKLQLIDNPVTDAFVTDSGDVFLKLEDDDDWLAIEGAQGKMLRVNDFIAKIDDKTVVFDSEVDYFVATGEFATLQVNESAEIWLDDDEDRAFAGDFRVIDATNSNGSNTLAGNTDDNTIFGGQGDNSLWGGDGAEGDDVLYGGGGQNAFFYAIGNGSDTIRGANDGDDVVLHGISLDQIANANISADSVEIQFTDGGSVRVEGTANVTYHLGDGSKFSADHNQGEWNAK